MTPLSHQLHNVNSGVTPHGTTLFGMEYAG